MEFNDRSIFSQRRKKLIEKVRSTYADKQGAIVLFAGFEYERNRFRQESTFYYFTGLHEPAVVLIMHTDGRQVLYLPNFGKERHKWVSVSVDVTSNPNDFGLTEITYLSEEVKGYSYSPFFAEQNYTYLLRDLKKIIDNGGVLFTVLDNQNNGCLAQYYLLQEMQRVLPKLQDKIQNIADLVYAMRRVKDARELALIKKAIEITVIAQKKAATTISPGVHEYTVQAALEHAFTGNKAYHSSFPSIVATGKNSTILHYIDNNQMIKAEDLVVIDIGAEYEYYAADLTRTYPASGKFSARQKEIYQCVLDTQEYVAQHAKPGMFLRNAAKKEQSLHYLATQFLQKAGYMQYFPHGIGHYLGLDVHDVGTYETPLHVGDVSTIEPGIYISQEGIGVRIEDNYVIQENGAECLSVYLDKTIDAIENSMKGC